MFKTYAFIVIGHFYILVSVETFHVVQVYFKIFYSYLVNNTLAYAFCSNLCAFPLDVG